MTDTTTTFDDLMARIDAERREWSIFKKATMQFRWKVAQPAREFPRRVRWFIQRGRRGWSTCDMWGTDSHIARVNAEMMAELRRVAHGHPVGLSIESSEPWINNADKRAEVMAQIEAIDVQIGFEGDYDDGFERWKAMLTYFERGWRDAATYIDDMDIEAHDRFKAMLPLYGEWFGGLWD